MTTGTLPQRNVAPWADFSTMQAHHLTTLWVRAGLEYDLAGQEWNELELDARTNKIWWLLVLSATAASASDRWCIIE